MSEKVSYHKKKKKQKCFLKGNTYHCQVDQRTPQNFLSKHLLLPPTGRGERQCGIPRHPEPTQVASDTYLRKWAEPDSFFGAHLAG